MSPGGLGERGTSRPPPRPLDSLTSLRFFAAMAIVLFHLRFLMPRFYTGEWFDPLSCGVGFFFVLSGFVLTYSCSTLPPRAFYTRRLARIYPLHLLTLLVWAILFRPAWGLPMDQQYNSIAANLLLAHAFLAGLPFSLGCNGVSWSLSVEAFFYLLFPWLRRGGRAGAAMLCVAAAIAGLWAAGQMPAIRAWFPGFTTFFPPARLAEFCAGIVTARLFVGGMASRAGPGGARRMRWATAVELGAVALLTTQILASPLVPIPVLTLYYIPGFAALIYVFAHEQGALSRRLARSRTLVTLGHASFALYLWHHMIEHLAGDRLPHWLPPWAAVGGTLAAAIGVSLASYRCFETPARVWVLARLDRSADSAEPGATAAAAGAAAPAGRTATITLRPRRPAVGGQNGSAGGGAANGMGLRREGRWRA